MDNPNTSEFNVLLRGRHSKSYQPGASLTKGELAEIELEVRKSKPKMANLSEENIREQLIIKRESENETLDSEIADLLERKSVSERVLLRDALRDKKVSAKKNTTKNIILAFLIIWLIYSFVDLLQTII